LEGFETLGATWGAAMVTRRLREFGFNRYLRGPRSTTRAHPAGLTQREQEILQLIAEGDSNGEIATKLYVSRKTVEHHVSSILTKLGVSRRSHAVSAERRLIERQQFKGDASPN
jgi:DNA-binding NarL/FixJ family response regulator